MNGPISRPVPPVKSVKSVKSVCFPGFSAHELAKLARRFARDGVLGTFFCGIGEQVDFYVTAKLYDDATQDVDAILDEFFGRYFGAAARPMQAF